MEWTTLLLFFSGNEAGLEAMKDFAREHPFSLLHANIEKVEELDRYIRIHVMEGRVAAVMAVALAYGAIPHVLRNE